MFASTLTRRITSSQVARRNMSMFDVKNTIHATREKFYLNPGVGEPIHLKKPGDKFVFYFAAGGVAIGFSSVLLGVLDMSFGWNKK